MNQETMEIIAPETSAAVQAIETAQVDQQIATAKAYPRDPVKAVRNVESFVAASKEIAEECIYSRPVGGGKFADGASIRMAELLFQEWGNCRGGVQHVSTDAKSVTCEGFVWDLEKNAIFKDSVTRPIVDRNGRRFSDSMIATTVKAAQAIAFRGAVFKVIPKALWNSAYERAVQVACEDETPLVDRVKNAFQWFKGQGVEREWLLSAIGRSHEREIVSRDFATIYGIRNSLKAGTLKADDLNPAKARRELKPEEVKTPFDDAPKMETKPKKKAAKKPEPEPKTYESVAFLGEATSLDDLHSRYDGTNQDVLDSDERTAFCAAYETLCAEWEAKSQA